MGKLILRELLIFVLGSLILIGIGLLFANREHKEIKSQSISRRELIMNFWEEADQKLIESYRKHADILSREEIITGSEKFPIDTLIDPFIQAVGDERISREVSRLKLKYWNSLNDNNNSQIGWVYEPNHYIKDSIYPITYDAIIRNIDLMAELSEKLRNNPRSTITDSLDIYLSTLDETSTESGPVELKEPLEILVFVSLSIFLLTTVVTIFSRFLARWLAAAYIQDMIAGQGRAAGLRYKLLPYLLSLPAFAPAALFMRAELGLFAKMLLLVAIMVLAGGLSFELALKYLEQAGREYQKPYVRFLSFYKRDKSRRGAAGLLQLIFVPHRARQLKSSGSMLPFVLTGTDYQLLPHVRRRMCVVVDSYALAGIVLGFAFWDKLNKPDLVQMLSETTRSYGASQSLLWMAEAILLGLFVAKLVFILSEARQLSQE